MDLIGHSHDGSLSIINNIIIIKFGYNARCHLLKEYALSEYKAQSWAKAQRQLLPVTVYSPSTCGMKWQGELLKNYQTRYKYTKMILEFSWQFAQTTLHPIQKKGTVMVLYLKVTTQWPQSQAGTILSRVKCSRQTLKLVCHPYAIITES